VPSRTSRLDGDGAGAVIAAHADDLPFEDGTFDAAVASLVLCSVPGPGRAR